jgi:hypothetical protein
VGGVGSELAEESAMPPEGGRVAVPDGSVDGDGAVCEGVMIAAGLAPGTARPWPIVTSDLEGSPHSPTPSADCGVAEAWRTTNRRLSAIF